MSKKNEVLQTIFQTRLIAVIRLVENEKLLPACEALQAGGVKALEITLTMPNPLETIRQLSSRKAAGTIVGAGSVLDAETARAAILAGAEFVVSPVTNHGMIRLCNRYGVAVVAGALTPTEIVTAWQLGADIVKIFPASSLGPRYIKDIKAPLPQVELMPTGGVTLENAAEFIRSGACGVAMGSELLDKAMIAAQNWMALTERARQLLAALAVK